MSTIRDSSMLAAICCCVIILGTGAAMAASPAYCALYAREYTAQFTTGSSADAAMASDYRIQEQAYYQCLNMDVEPEFPKTSVYFGQSLADILGGGVGVPNDAIAQGDASADVPDVPAATKPVSQPVKTASTARRSGRGSGLAAGSPELEAWCKAHFPNSFDPADGTVKPYGENRRPCK